MSSALFFLGHTIVIIFRIKSGIVIVWTCEGCIWNQVNTTSRCYLRSCLKSSVKTWKISINIVHLPCDIQIGNLLIAMSAISSTGV
jgi:hypothetical protein